MIVIIFSFQIVLFLLKKALFFSFKKKTCTYSLKNHHACSKNGPERLEDETPEVETALSLYKSITDLKHNFLYSGGVREGLVNQIMVAA